MPIPLRVLLIQEELETFQPIADELERAGFQAEIRRVEIERDYLCQLDAGTDIVISEYALRQFDALRALHILEERSLPIPLVVMSGRLGEELAVECIKQGAADFLLKTRLNRLGQAVKRVLQESKIRKDREQAQASLQAEVEGYRQIVESSPNGMAVLDQDRIDFINHAGTLLLGAASPKQLTERTFSDFVHPECQTMVEENLQRVKKDSDCAAQFEGRFLALGGQGIDLILEAAPLVENGSEKVLIVFRNVTKNAQERQQELDRAKEQELLTFHAQLLAQSGEAIFAVDNEQLVTYWNKAAERMYRISAEQILGHPIDELFYQRWTKNEDETTCREKLAKTGLWQGEQIHVKHYGESINVACSVSLLTDETGNPKGSLSLVRDITQVKRTEDKLRKERNFYSSVLTAAGNPLVVLDNQGRFLFFNRACEELTGYQLSEVRKEFFWDSLLSAEDGETARLFFQNLSPDQFPRQREATLLTKEGEQRLVAWIDNVLTDDKNSVACVVSTGVDITESRKVEQDDSRRAAYLSSLSDNMVELVMILNPSGVIQFVSPSVKNLLGNKGRTFESRNLLDLVHPDDRTSATQALQSIQRQTEKTGSLDFRIQHRNGEWRSFEGLTKNLLDQPDISGILLTARDASRRKQVEEGVLRQLQSLESLRAIDIATNSSLDMQVLVKVILERVIYHLGIGAACILLFNRKTLELEYLAGKGFQNIDFIRSRVRLGEGAAGRAALERKLMRHSSSQEFDEPAARAELLASERFAVYWALPLVARGELKGVLEIFNRDPVPSTSDWSDFLSTVASQTANAIDTSQLIYELRRQSDQADLAYDVTLERVSELLDLRERHHPVHSLRLAQLTVELGKALGLDDAFLIHIRRGALLHDIGKIQVPEEILLKAGPLSEREWEIMRQYPLHAKRILSQIPHLREAMYIPYCHREKWDGSGYPRGLKGNEIPIEARIFSVIEAFDVLRSHRPHREAWSTARALKHLQRQAGTEFDPQVVDKFLELQKSGELMSAASTGRTQ